MWRKFFGVVLLVLVTLLPILWLHGHPSALPKRLLSIPNVKQLIQRNTIEESMPIELKIKKDQFCVSLLPVAQKGVRDNLTVHVLVVNRGVIRLLENLLCSLERVLERPVQVAVFGMDLDTCPFLSHLPVFAHSVCIPYAERMMKQLEEFEPLSYQQFQALEAGSLRNSEVFGSVTHKVLINAKLYATRDILDCGFACFTTDIDVVFFKDVLAYFNSAIIRKPTLTLLFQKDQNEANYKLDINSGFFFALSTAENLRFFTDVITKAVWWHIDQSRVNQFLASGNYTSNKSWTLLPIDAFPVGDQVLAHERSNTKYNSSVLVAGHANWSPNMGRKFHMLVTVGWWFTNFSTHECLTERHLEASFRISDFWPNCTDKLWDCEISDR